MAVAADELKMMYAPHSFYTLIRCLILAALFGVAVPACALAADGAPDDDEACTTLFSNDDSRLFDFVGTRKTVDFTAWTGHRIGHVEYVTLPVFNSAYPEENRPIYRGANHLHVLTRATTLRKQLLVAEGDAVDDDRIRQSERILRANGYLYDAMILPARVCADSLDLLVVVRDIWTLQPSANFSRSGGNNNSSFGFSEDNLLGGGRQLSLSMESAATRNSTVLSYEDGHAFGGRWIFSLSHADNSDGYRNGFSLQRPFYAFDTRDSFGARFSDETLTETTSAGGVTSNRYDHHEQFAEVFAGWLATQDGDSANRWRAGITLDSNRYSNQQPGSTDPLPTDLVFVYPWLEFEHAENRFVTMSNVSRMFRNEDIDVGNGWRLRGGMTDHRLGSEADGILLQADWHDTLASGRHHLLRQSASADVFMNETNDSQRDSLYGYRLRYDFFIDERNRWLAGLKIDAGESLSPENELTTGGANGLLGYPDAWQRGDRRAVLAVERRHFLEAHPLNLFRVATAAFAETGSAWDSHGTQGADAIADVGIGLRLNSSKARSNSILQFNVAVPLINGTASGGVQWSVFAGETF